MKKCKSCQMEIDQKASKCPHCQADQRNWFAKHPILTVILALIIIGILSPKDKSTSESTTNNPAAETTLASPTPLPEPEKITAKELADSFDENQVAAETKWGGKLVQFSATITNITERGISFSNVASKDFSMAQISCNIANKDQLLPLKNGQKITVVGTVGSQTIGVISLDDCSVVE